MLEIKNIRKAFNGQEILKGVDIKVNKGDVVTILGPSGSGKTTLLRCINFLEKADEGTMVFACMASLLVGFGMALASVATSTYAVEVASEQDYPMKEVERRSYEKSTYFNYLSHSHSADCMFKKSIRSASTDSVNGGWGKYGDRSGLAAG